MEEKGCEGSRDKAHRRHGERNAKRTLEMRKHDGGQTSAGNCDYEASSSSDGFRRSERWTTMMKRDGSS